MPPFLNRSLTYCFATTLKRKLPPQPILNNLSSTYAPQIVDGSLFVGHTFPMDDINIIKDTLKEELDRNARSQRAYELECKKLPRGSVTLRVRGKKEYCYLRYREGSRTVTQYMGSAEAVEDGLRKQVARRKELESVIKRLKREESFIRKALRHS